MLGQTKNCKQLIAYNENACGIRYPIQTYNIPGIHQ